MHPKEEKTFVIIKPDGVRKGLIGDIISRFERRDLKVVALEMFHPSRKEMDNHYPKDEKWIRRLGEKTMATYAKYGHDVKKIVQGVHAVDMVRKIVGPTMPYLAEMGTIRGDFSNDSPLNANVERRSVYNLVHASETPEEAKHEIQHWFGKNAPLYKYKRFGVDE